MASDAMTRAGGTGAPARSRGMADAGLSIVVPLFNEAANLAALHARIVEVAGALKATRGLTTRGRLCRRRQPRWHARRCARTPSRQSRRAGDLAVAQFRQGGGAARRPRSRPLGRRTVHGRRRPASAHAGREARGPLARSGLRRGLHRQGASRERAVAAPLRGQGVLQLDQLGRAAKNPRGRRRFSLALAARGGGAANSFPSATASSRDSRAGSDFVRSASTTSRQSASTAPPPGICIR